NFPKGYTYVVDLKYPEHLHEVHNDYPLVPKNIEVRFQDIKRNLTMMKILVTENSYKDQNYARTSWIRKNMLYITEHSNIIPYNESDLYTSLFTQSPNR